jgi:RNA polymerase sigma-70 factor (ECF subfamily)
VTPLDSQGSGVPAAGGRGPSDADLVLRCQRGEGPAFNDLVSRHQDRIYNIVLRFCGNAEDARDVSQRAFINAYRKIGEFKGESAFATWLTRIAFNQAVSFRRERKHRELSLTPKNEDGPLVEPADDRSPAEGLESDETRKKVQQALALLDEGDRQVILLKDIQGCSYDEIASVLAIPKGTVRSRLHRARLELKTKLKPFIGTLQ